MFNLQSSKPIHLSLPNVYRYMNKNYCDLFLKEGILRISSFKRFQEYPDEIRGDANEGGGVYETFSKEGTQNLTFINTGQNGYMLCTSLLYDESLMKDFEVDCCLKINDPVNFLNAILNAIPGSNAAFLGFCNYKEFRNVTKNINPFSDTDDLNENGELIIGGHNFNQRIQETIGSGMDLMFLKELKYQNQFEFRFVWNIDTRHFEVEDYIDIKCKEAIQYCEIMK